MRNRLPRTQCRQVGRQQPEGRQNHPGKRLYLHQAQQRRSCSQWFRRKRHKHYYMLHGLWCLLRLPGAVTEVSHLTREFPSHWLQQGNQQRVLRRSAKLAELLVRRWMEQIPKRTLELLKNSTGKMDVLLRMICAIINHWMISTQRRIVCVLKSSVPLIVHVCNIYSYNMWYQSCNLSDIISDDFD